MFLGLALLSLALWGGVYLNINAIACAFQTTPGCAFRPPWRLGAGDFIFLILKSGTIPLALGLVARVFHRIARRQDQNNDS